MINTDQLIYQIRTALPVIVDATAVVVKTAMDQAIMACVSIEQRKVLRAEYLHAALRIVATLRAGGYSGLFPSWDRIRSGLGRA